MARIGCKITSLAILMVHSGAESAYPNTRTYNLKNIDAQVRFGTLAKGTYYYCVSASNEHVTTFFSAKKFTVS